MDTMKTLLEHRSIRKYKSDPIPEAILSKVLDAAIRASTTGNMQVYSIIVTKDQEVKDALWPFHFRQNMVKEAPLVLTFCADFNRFNKWCLQRDADPGYDNFLSFMTAAIDALLAAQNAAVAAEDQGLGICYLGTTTYMAEEIAEVLSCPEGVVPITSLVMGYPDEAPDLTDRLPAEAVVHDDVYKDPSPEEINAFYLAKESLPFTQQLIEENQLENLAQIFTQKRYTRKDNIGFSNKFLEYIKKQGFMNQ